MGTKNNPGAFDCYAAAEPDEPMFILLGRDKHAPTLVWLWAALRELEGEDPPKVADARNCVVQMITFATDKGKQVPGVGASVLVGVLELIRAANYAVNNAGNAPTGVDLLRRLLAETRLEPDGPTPQEPDPIREQLAEACRYVADMLAQLVPDGDREVSLAVRLGCMGGARAEHLCLTALQAHEANLKGAQS